MYKILLLVLLSVLVVSSAYGITSTSVTVEKQDSHSVMAETDTFAAMISNPANIYQASMMISIPGLQAAPQGMICQCVRSCMEQSDPNACVLWCCATDSSCASACY
ncbi:MAG: hypothetical protein Tsb002_32070 [Wenzhouxiangellaceae bacterium]